MEKAQLVGRVIALGAAVFYGFNTTLSRLAYDTGTNPLSLTLFRFVGSALLLVVIVLLWRKSCRLAVAPLTFLLCVCGMVGTSIGHLGAVNFIPVSLSAIIFYTFPLQVAAYKRIAQRQPVTRNELIAFLVAFAGIGIALGPDFHEFDPIGIALAFGGSVSAALFILSYEHFPANTDSIVATLWIMLASVALCLLALPLGFELAPPGEPVGWVYLAAITLTSVTAFVLSLRAIDRVGGATFALFLNFEPVIIFLLAWIVIDEALSPERIAGIGLIVFALFLSHWRDTQARLRAPGTP